MRKKIEVYCEDGSSEELNLPAKYEVCPRCDGRGVHDCWSGGMTGDEMAEQGPEFFDDYMSGMYDTRCEECNGDRVVLEVDRSQAKAEDLVKLDKHHADGWAYQAEIDAERRMGA